MICVAVMYPNAADVKFDIDYYRDQHLPLVPGAAFISRFQRDSGLVPIPSSRVTQA